MATKHPPGLYVLFFTELWERYSFYSMMAILSLYMNESLHFDVAHVGRVFGLYNGGRLHPPGRSAACWPIGCSASAGRSSWAAC